MPTTSSRHRTDPGDGRESAGNGEIAEPTESPLDPANAPNEKTGLVRAATFATTARGSLAMGAGSETVGCRGVNDTMKLIN